MVRSYDYKLKFGKHRGKSLYDIFMEDMGYIKWLHENTEDKLIVELCNELLQKETEIECNMEFDF